MVRPRGKERDRERGRKKEGEKLTISTYRVVSWLMLAKEELVNELILLLLKSLTQTENTFNSTSKWNSFKIVFHLLICEKE